MNHLVFYHAFITVTPSVRLFHISDAMGYSWAAVRSICDVSCYCQGGIGITYFLMMKKRCYKYGSSSCLYFPLRLRLSSTSCSALPSSSGTVSCFTRYSI